MDIGKYEKLFKPQESNLSIFHDLMPFKVKEILLVATVYDAYILEREGQIFEQIYGEYYQLNISSAPRITSVFSLENAIKEIQTGRFDLVIIVTGLDKNITIELSRKIRDINASLPVLLLINNNNQIAIYECMMESLVDVNKMFVWNGDSSIFLAMIKYIEDSTNVSRDTSIGDVRVILVVEDSIRYYSRYLPTLYSVIISEVHRLISGEDVDARYKLLKMRARPKVLLASNYEQAVKLFEKYSEYLICVITDVKYPLDGVPDESAGKKLIRLIKQRLSVPILMQSSDPGNMVFAAQNNLGYIDKNSQNLSRELVDFFHLNLGFGNFLFRDDRGKVYAEARYMKEFEVLIDTIPCESIMYHSNRNDFSTWFMAKGEIKSALRLKKVRTEDFNSPEEIRAFVKNVLRERWLETKRDSISVFSENAFKEKSYLMRISNGSVGGKGRGVAFTESILQKSDFKSLMEGINVTIPKTIIVGTDEFESFIEQFDYCEFIQTEHVYEQTRRLFSAMKLSSLLSQRLKKMLDKMKCPLAVRSSGLFEDSLSQPFSGIYETYYLPNNHPNIEVRLKQLETAIKMVYASVFSPLARSYFDSINHSIEEEKMAVIIQELVGRPYKRYFYPHISGVAQSYNYYPFSHMKPEDGIGLIAVGMGKSIVDGEESYRFCPKYPKMIMLTIKGMLQNSQRSFYALDIQKNNVDLVRGTDATLEKIPILKAEEHGTLTWSASVYDAASNTVRPGLHMEGPRIVDFSYILQYDQVPLAATVLKLLEIMRSALGAPVEIEFSVDLNKDSSGKATFYILQVKPLIRSVDSMVVDTSLVEKSDLILYSDQGMGNGIVEGIRDIIYVLPESFDKMQTRQIAKEIHEINFGMKKAGTKYILIGPGRWGSSDPFLGIPVDWTAISEARIIVEAGIKDFNVDASLGSHFFHNITSMNIGYFTVSPKSAKAFIDYNYLSSFNAVKESGYLRHVSLPEAVTVIMDGRKSVSLITRSGWGARIRTFHQGHSGKKPCSMLIDNTTGAIYLDYNCPSQGQAESQVSVFSTLPTLIQDFPAPETGRP